MPLGTEGLRVPEVISLGYVVVHPDVEGMVRLKPVRAAGRVSGKVRLGVHAPYNGLCILVQDAGMLNTFSPALAPDVGFSSLVV